MLELIKQMEVDFLKTKTYEEINDMFNQLNDKLKLAEKEVETLRAKTCKCSWCNKRKLVKNSYLVDKNDNSSKRMYICEKCNLQLDIV